MSKLNFQLVTPERTVLSQELTSLSCPTTLGQITILPGHIPLVATLITGELVAKSGETENFIHVSGGFVEVKKGNQISILADSAEHYYEIDEKRAQEAIDRAKKAMEQSNMSDMEYAKVSASLERSLSRINISRKHAHRRKTPITGAGTFNQ